LTRTKEGREIFVPRATIANIASAAGVDCIDTPFTDVNDPEGLLADTLLAKSLGYQGKVAINPRQIDTIHQAYAPTETEIRWAQRVVEAVEEGKRKGSGVVAVGGKMIDPPVVARASRTIDMAIALHLVEGA
jgi:citrate lyase subunit beta/citryl-CoA lyase